MESLEGGAAEEDCALCVLTGEGRREGVGAEATRGRTGKRRGGGGATILLCTRTCHVYRQRRQRLD